MSSSFFTAQASLCLACIMIDLEQGATSALLLQSYDCNTVRFSENDIKMYKYEVNDLKQQDNVCTNLVKMMKSYSSWLWMCFLFCFSVKIGAGARVKDKVRDPELMFWEGVSISMAGDWLKKTSYLHLTLVWRARPFYALECVDMISMQVLTKFSM